MLRRPFPLAATFLLTVLAGATGGVSSYGSDGENFFAAEAEAISAAVERAGTAVVQIELVGVAEVGGGEVAADAPSVGTVIDPEGLILASSMVTARPAASILVVLPDGTRLPADVVGKDEGRHLVLLRVEPEEPLPAVALAPVDDVRVGQYAIAVGRIRPDGPPAKSVGIISALGRLQGRAMQTDARVSPPFYGGPLLDIRGRIVGIVVPAMPDMGDGGESTGWYDAGIGIVAPVTQIAERLEKLKQGETIQPGQLGIVAGSNDPFAEGTTVAAVRVGSPAADVEIQPGDEIVEIDGTPVRRHAEVRQALGPRDAGSSVSIVLRRDGEQITVTPTLVNEIPPFQPQMFGLLVDREDDIRVTAVFPGSPAERAGLQVGDTIRSIGENEVESVDQLRRRVMTLRGEQATAVTVVREGDEHAIDITPAPIAGRLAEQLPTLPGEAIEGEWTVEALTIPDVPNKAAVIAPEDVPEGTSLGLLIVFAEPGAEDVEQLCQAWSDAAREHRVVVGVLGSSDPASWNPEEAEIGRRLAAMIRQQYAAVLPAAVGVTGDGPGGAMAMIAAWGEASPFGGAAVSSEVRPPAIRLSENDPASPIQLLIRGDQSLPPWASGLGRGGYAVVTADDSRTAATRWIWTLARI